MKSSSSCRPRHVLLGVVVLVGTAASRTSSIRRKLADGERLEVGEGCSSRCIRQGHTPEHISLLVIDRSRGEETYLAALIDVARPDLLGSREDHASAKRSAGSDDLR